MKTYPIHNSDGTLKGFEITSAWVFFRPLIKILNSVEGVTEVKRQWFNEDRIAFKFHGVFAVVNEPWGDNSRFWVGLQEPELHPNTNLAPLHEAFKNYRGGTIFYLQSKEPVNGI